MRRTAATHGAAPGAAYGAAPGSAYGAALVTSLLVLAACAALALGALLLARLDAAMAGHALAQAEAEAAARAGLNAALLLLADEVAAAGGLPTTVPELPAIAGIAFALERYQLLAPDEAVVRLSGRAAREARARHQVEALLVVRRDLPAEAFARVVTSGARLELAGGPVVGDMAAGGNLVVHDLGFAPAAGARAVAGGAVCRLGGVDCETGAEVPPPPRPDIAAMSAAILSAHGPCTLTLAGQNLVVTPVPGAVICLAPNSTVTVRGGGASGVFLGDATTSLALEGVQEAPLTMIGGTVHLRSGALLTSPSTVLAYGQVILEGELLDAGAAIGSLLAAGGSVDATGAGLLEAAIWAGGDVTLGGATSVRGAVVAGGSVEASETVAGLRWAEAASPWLPRGGRPQLQVVSRR